LSTIPNEPREFIEKDPKTVIKIPSITGKPPTQPRVARYLRLWRSRPYISGHIILHHPNRLCQQLFLKISTLPGSTYENIAKPGLFLFTRPGTPAIDVYGRPSPHLIGGYGSTGITHTERSIEGGQYSAAHE
jgi:hypothetical protein